VTGNPPALVFSKAYGGYGYDWAGCVAQTPDSGFIFAGQSESFGAGSYDIWVLRLNRQGDTLWSRAYGTSMPDLAYAIIPESDGGCTIAGSGYPGFNGSDIWFLRLNSNGDTTWTRMYGTGQNDVAYDMRKTSDGGYIVSGQRLSSSPSSGDAWILKLNANGEKQWDSYFGGAGADAAQDVEETSDGGFVFVGNYRWDEGETDLWLLKTSATGDSLWAQYHGGPADDIGYAITKGPAGGFVVAGQTKSTGAGGSDLWIMGVDQAGNELWSKTYGGPSDDAAFDICRASDGQYLVTGRTSSFGGGQFDVWLLKIDAAGDTVWTTTLGGSGWDGGTAGIETKDGGYVIAAQTESMGAGAHDYWCIRLAPDHVMGIGEDVEVSPSSFRLEQNYPNPFNPSTNMSFVIRNSSLVTLKVYDILGREVATLVDGVEQAGEHTAVWNAGDLPAGFYICRLMTGGHIQSIKLLLLK
jgi:hypothetical protein